MPSSAFGLSLDPWGRLVLIDALGARHVGVEPVRAFPLADPSRWISLVDESGREVAMVESLDDLAPAVRGLLLDELARREFIPTITRIVSVSRDTLPCEWEVETDRGPTRFTLESEDQIRRLGPGRLLITDARGLRYQVPAIERLEPRSRRRLERYL
jgi:hypothetical protein